MLRGLPVYRQVLIAMGVTVLVAALSYFLRTYLDYRIVALLLLLMVSLMAVLFDIWPVLLSAVLSALILNIFFIEPTLHYKINSPESALLFFIYIVVALVNAVLTNRLRTQEARVRDREEKEKAIQLYNTLLSSLSHELKTPIATVLAAADTLQEGGERIALEQRAELLVAIEQAAGRLNQQVENLLNMSRLETGTLALKRDWTDVNELIFRVISGLPPKELHRITYQADDKVPLFKVDEGLLEIVLVGLVENALRYTSSSTEMTIHIGYDDDTLLIIVRDGGEGIPDDEKRKVFEKFYRRHAAGTGGTGLGLSIAKGIVEAHGGTIHLEDGLGGGAQFEVRLPAEISYLKNLKNE